VVSDAEPAWSDEIRQASWIGERLAPFGAYVVTSVVPGGFEAYARVLHPAGEPLHGGRLVRWAEVAAWSGLSLRPGSQSQTAGQLLSTGEATVTTSRGTLRASLERPGRLTPGMLLVQTIGDNGVTGSSSTRLSGRPEQDLREKISHRLARDIIELVGG
jgi:hypothetical protein